MKLKYLGILRRDGSYPKVNVGGEDIQIVDGFVDVSDKYAEELLANGVFKAEANKPVAAKVVVEEVKAAPKAATKAK